LPILFRFGWNHIDVNCSLDSFEIYTVHWCWHWIRFVVLSIGQIESLSDSCQIETSKNGLFWRFGVWQLRAKTQALFSLLCKSLPLAMDLGGSGCFWAEGEFSKDCWTASPNIMNTNDPYPDFGAEGVPKSDPDFRECIPIIMIYNDSHFFWWMTIDRMDERNPYGAFLK